MARPRMTPEESQKIIAAQADKNLSALSPEQKAVAVKNFQMGLPSDITGNVVSHRASSGAEMEATAIGIVMRKGKRKVLVPWGNVKCAEFVWDRE